MKWKKAVECWATGRWQETEGKAIQDGGQTSYAVWSRDMGDNETTGMQ